MTTEERTLTPAYIAATVLERRTRMNPTVFQGEIMDDLGSEGLKEAIDRRWLIPDHDTGYLQVTNEDSKVREMEAIVTEAAREIVANGGKLPERPTLEGDEQTDIRRLVLGHAGRERIRESTYGVGYTGSGAPTMGAGNSPAGSAPPARNPNPTPSGTSGQKPDPEIGNDVTVVEDGKSYIAKVKERGKDGMYTLSFGGGQKPPVTRQYKSTEIKPTERGAGQ